MKNPPVVGLKPLGCCTYYFPQQDVVRVETRNAVLYSGCWEPWALKHLAAVDGDL